MSIEARQYLCTKLIFQKASQQIDLMDDTVTNTGLIALLLDLVKVCPIEITAVKTDHHDDSALGKYCHFNGYAVDCWPLYQATAGNYVDQDASLFQTFLKAAAASPWLWQIGLAGEAVTDANIKAAGPTYYLDDGDAHVHFGAV